VKKLEAQAAMEPDAALWKKRAGKEGVERMTEYHVFLCIVGLTAVGFVAVSVARSLRGRTSHVGDGTLGTSVHRSQQPVLFWTQIVAQIVGAVVVLAAILISIFRSG
jgi:hypothetical protein